MTEEFLAGLGIDGETAKAVLEAAEKEKSALEERAEQLENELAAVKLDGAVDGELRRFGAKNLQAVTALLELDGITPDEEGVETLTKQLEKLKEENGYLFGGVEVPRIVAPSGGKSGKSFGFKFTGVR